ncbi:Hypothetical predicted protein [Pelobates cultripes]|uniref:Uncharacterized protein n=1 Tax=Pelobates cultripes TaxID=61616 RepID=A0AAD1W130_PELCU|nr:Hypothetical predicted protein [Pelobates cultripes]
MGTMSSSISQTLAQALFIPQGLPANMVTADKSAPTARKVTTKMKHVSPHSMNQALPELTDTFDAIPDGTILRPENGNGHGPERKGRTATRVRGLS